ncbi:MAG: hypothetical protein K2N28_01085 [Muribaculaceae bacterium]|nr:hypothetical protein [Muribaculaceae bacterium]
MKKKFMAVAIALIGTCMAISAQTPTTTNDNNTQTEQTCCKKNGKGEKHNRKGMKPGKGHKGHFNPFEGIELTQEQKDAMKAMRQEQQANAKANREEAMKQRDEKLQTILTPEQYAQYKQNVEKAKANRPADGKTMPARDNMRRGAHQR